MPAVLRPTVFFLWWFVSTDYIATSHHPKQDRHVGWESMQKACLLWRSVLTSEPSTWFHGGDEAAFPEFLYRLQEFVIFCKYQLERLWRLWSSVLSLPLSLPSPFSPSPITYNNPPKWHRCKRSRWFDGGKLCVKGLWLRCESLSFSRALAGEDWCMA